MAEVVCPRCDGSGVVDLTTREALGLNIRAYREREGITQEQLAEKLRITRTQLANMETGRSGTTIDGLLDLSQAMGVSVDSLLNGLPSDSEDES